MVKSNKWKGRLIALAIIIAVLAGVGIGIYYFTRDTIDNYNEYVVTKGNITTYTTFSGKYVTLPEENIVAANEGTLTFIVPDNTVIGKDEVYRKVGEDVSGKVVATVKKSDNTVVNLYSKIPGRAALYSFKVGDTVAVNSLLMTVFNFYSVGDHTIPLGEGELPYMKSLFSADNDEDITVLFNALRNSKGGTLTAVGKIKEIPVKAINGSFTYTITIATDDEHKMLTSGYSMQIRLLKSRLTDILCLPRTAIQTDPTGKAYVQVLENEKLTVRYITLGANDSSKVQIRTGLEENEVVYTPKPSSKKNLIASFF